LCYRKLADEESRKLQDQGAEGKSAGYLRERRRGFLALAAKVYQDLAGDLEKVPTATSEQQVLLTRCLFAIADQYQEMEEFGEAIRRYKIVLEKYRGKREQVIACQRIWTCAKPLYLNPATRRQALEDSRDALQTTLSEIEKMAPD